MTVAASTERIWFVRSLHCPVAQQLQIGTSASCIVHDMAQSLKPRHLQVYCYEDSKLLKLFSQILRILYDADVLGEAAILFWYKKGSHPKGRNVFLHDVEPFIKWLEEDEEEGEDDD